MEWIGTAILLGIALAMDCLALSITDGLVYKGLKVWQAFFIAFVYAALQGLFPLAGYFLGETFIDHISPWHLLVAFGLLAIIGGKMAFDGIKGIIKPEEKKEGKFSIPSVLLQGVADSIDAFAVGITIKVTICPNDPASVTMATTLWVIGIIPFARSSSLCLGFSWGKASINCCVAIMKSPISSADWCSLALALKRWWTSSSPSFERVECSYLLR